MGLNDGYGQARGTILMMNPLPNINRAYSLILQDENKREVYAKPLISTDSSSFMVGNKNNLLGMQIFHKRMGSKHSWTYGQYQKLGNNFQKTTNTSLKSSTFKGKKIKFNPNVSCTHCKKVGHTVSDYYKIIGFPEDFKFTKGNQMQVRSNSAFSMEHGDDNNNNYNDTTNQHLSKDQFSQLVQLIK